MVSEFKKKHVKELRAWIEKRLSEDITVTDVCNRSGYSQWYLQQLFRSETGCSINEYIRFRRLYRCVLLLRFSSMPIMNIASYYKFGGANVFSRIFRKVFGITPSAFRENATLNLSVLDAGINIIDSDAPSPQIEYVYFDGAPVYGVSGGWQVPAQEYDRPATWLKSTIEADFMARTRGEADEVYTQLRHQYSAAQSGMLDAEYSVGVCGTAAGDYSGRLEALPPLLGDYLQFSCRNIQCTHYEFVVRVYWDIIFRNNITLRKDYELERICYKTRHRNGLRDEVDYHYLLPIVFDEHIHSLLVQ